MKIVVVGAGKMGLPLACQFAHRGADVTVCDVKQSVVDTINRGECPIDEPGVNELLADVFTRGRIRASTDTTDATRKASVIVVIVPVLLTPGNDADLSTIELVSRQIAAGLQPGSMVSYETTLPVGTTRGLSKILELSGLQAGVDFDVVFSPERVKSRLVLNHLTANSKVIGALTPRAGERAVHFYSEYLGAPVINIGTLEAAELVKLAGMVYRDVNIALANEIAGYAEAVGVDLHAILPAINSDGEAAMLSPGIGVGGHCAPVYPNFLIRDGERCGLEMSLTRLGRQINDSQAVCCIDRIERVWMPLQGRSALILGLGFRPQVKEHTCSTSFLIGAELRKRGANVYLNDPLYTDQEIRGHGFDPLPLTASELPPVVILSTAHTAYAGLDFRDLAVRGVRVIVDGRALWLPQKVSDAGILYIGVGRPIPDWNSLSTHPQPFRIEDIKNDIRDLAERVTAALP
ncbi:MAG: nucleotide sugar dehydrogenase [Acidobacteriaceae bacterium]|nr:nucleotide sugar dehydrogenase [Acidobacteriaceae bacterium]